MFFATTSFSISTLLTVTLVAAIPLLLAALGGMYSERSGVINIGLEGMMLFGAFAAGWIGYQFPGSFWWTPWLGFLCGGLVGGLLAALHGVLSIHMKTDQIISGVAINILASQGTIFLALMSFGGKGGKGLIHTLGSVSFLGLELSPFLFVAVAILVFSHWQIFHSVFGLRLRACGEHPQAALSAGVSVVKMRYSGVIISGILAGFAGAILAQDAGNFSKEMTSGRGYVALAALIFGGWKPIPVFFACILFGFAYALNFQLQGNIQIPSEFLSMLPYVLTLLALTGLIKKTKAPAALGKVDQT